MPLFNFLTNFLQVDIFQSLFAAFGFYGLMLAFTKLLFR